MNDMRDLENGFKREPLGVGVGDSLPEPDAREALLNSRAGLALLAEAWREGASTMLRSTNAHEDGPWAKPENPYSKALRAAPSASGPFSNRRHPEPVKPSREDVARALYLADAVPNLASVAAPAWDNTPTYHAVRGYWLDQADAVLALWPGRSVAEVKAEALREAAGSRDLWGPHGEDDETPHRAWLRERADRIERDES